VTSRLGLREAIEAVQWIGRGLHGTPAEEILRHHGVLPPSPANIAHGFGRGKQ